MIQKTALLALATITLGLTACSEQPENKQTEEASVEVAQSITQVTIPTGRWLINDKHCDNQLDIRNLKDFNLHQQGIQKGEQLYLGEWSNTMDEPFDIAVFKPTNTDCVTFDNGATLSQLQTSSELYTFKVNAEKTAGIFHSKNTAHIIVRFDEAKLAEYNPVLDIEE